MRHPWQGKGRSKEEEELVVEEIAVSAGGQPTSLLGGNRRGHQMI